MPSKLGPHFIGTPGLPRWIESGPAVFKFDPTSLGASAQVPPGPLVIGKLDQLEDRIDLTDWKHYMNAGGSPADVAAHRFNAQRNIFVGASKPRVDRYLLNGRIDAWEDDNEVVPDNPDEARWYAAYCIAMMGHYESIGRRRANFCFAVGTPDMRPGNPADIWPHLLPAVRHAREHGHFLALHEYMGYEADLGVGWKQIDGQRRPIRHWYGRVDAVGNPVESYPYGYAVLRYRAIYDTYFRPEGLQDTPLVITEFGCDSVETVTPAGGTVGTWKEHVDFWRAGGGDPELVYAGMLKWYDEQIRLDPFVRGATIFTVGSVGVWAKWDISGTRVEDEILRHIQSSHNEVDSPMTDSDAVSMTIVSPTTTTGDAAAVAGFATDVDLNRVAGGVGFRATWTFRNSGPTTWDGRYRLVYSDTPHPETAANSRTPLGASDSYAITDIGAPPQVRPGESVSLTIGFVAPQTLGLYATNWQLAGPDGQRFGPIRWLRAAVVTQAGSLSYDVLGFENSAGDFNNLQPGHRFTGTWTLRNTGTRAWSGDFRVAYSDAPTPDTAQLPRDSMGAKPLYTLRQVSGRDNVAVGETVAIRLELVAPLGPGAYAFHWQLRSDRDEAFGGVRWLRVSVTGTVDGPGGSTQPAETGAVEFGMNINPEAHGLDVDKMTGLGWVRWVFWASRLKLSPEEAYQQKYRALIQTYANAGISSLIILHQDTEWGNAPWQNGGWQQYAETFARACGRVAAVCAEFGDRVAYQIFNEQDSGPDNHSAIGIAARDYAVVLDKAQAAIRRAHPGARVIIGGLNTGPDNAIRYAREVQAALGGRLPVDALAIHPYGRYVKKILFNYGYIGKLSDSLNRFRSAFPTLPLWITEVGVANDTPIGPEHYADIAIYIREFVDEVADQFNDYVKVLIWFGWTDLMRNAGILTADGQPKPNVFDAFVHMRQRGKADLEAFLAGGLEALDQSQAEFVSFASTQANLTAVPAGTTFTNTWRFRNTGATTWDAGFRLVYVPDGANSDPLMVATEFKLLSVAAPAPVPPGGETGIVLTLTAPANPGRVYRSRWQLRDPEGVAFAHLFAEITVVPAPTSGTGVRASAMTFLRDHTVPDGTQFVAGTDFHKQWAVRNDGVRHWGSGFRLVFVQGDVQMARGVSAHMVPESRPGDEVILTIPMTAPPAQDGRLTNYSSLWRMQDDHGAFFGDPVWAKIVSLPGTPAVDGRSILTMGAALGRLVNDPSAWYSQLDPRWSGVTMGFGAQRIEAWGCLMTCMAMTLSAYGSRVNPLELNERLKLEGDNGFIGSNVQFIAPAFVLPGLKQGVNLRSFEDADLPFSAWTGEDPLGRIDSALAMGYIVLAQVDTKPNDGLFNSNVEQHWVIIVKRTPGGDDYLILDPVVPAEQVRDQPRSLMVKYGNRVAGESNAINLRKAIKSTIVYSM